MHCVKKCWNACTHFSLYFHRRKYEKNVKKKGTVYCWHSHLCKKIRVFLVSKSINPKKGDYLDISTMHFM